MGNAKGCGAEARVDDVGEMRLKVSGEEPEYSGGECCRTEPFCEEHGLRSEALFYLVRVGAGGCADASVSVEGVRVRDSWCLGALDGLVHSVHRLVLTNVVREQKRAAGGESGSERSSSVLSAGSSSAAQEIALERAAAEARCEGAVLLGEGAPLLGGEQGAYGGCRCV